VCSWNPLTFSRVEQVEQLSEHVAEPESVLPLDLGYG
jgi:hypothetical protein